MSEQVQVYTYTVNIQSIKMKVKFPCKMKLQYEGEVFTSEVSQNEAGKFIFNQELTLKQDSSKTHFQILANLTTDKGAKYIAGVARLAQAELVHQEGEMMIVHLSKCLDSDASCQLRVDQVSSDKIIKKANADKSRQRQNIPDFAIKTNLLSPNIQPLYKKGMGTKSEFQFPLGRNKQMSQVRVKEQGHLSIRDRSRSPNNNFRKNNNVAISYIQRNLPAFGSIDVNNRDKLIEAEVYKESYQKLKEKYKKEADVAKNELNKRISLQNNENNYRLEIMRLKLKCEEQEKTLVQKNSKLKQIQMQLMSLQKKELDLNFIREESINREHNVKILEDTIRTLNRDNEDLKNLNRERFQNEQQKIKDLRIQIQGSRQKYESKVLELEREMKLKTDTISQKQSEIRIKDQRIQREQRLVDELQKNAQAKYFEYEKTLQNQQNEWKNRSQEFKQLITKLEREKSKLQEELKGSFQEQQKIKSLIVKFQYDKKILTQESDSFKTELVELKILKQKYQELTRDHRLVCDEKNHLQKQYQKTVQSKDFNITEINKQYQEQIQHYKRIYKEVEEKMRNYQGQNLQLQSLIEQKKNEVERSKRNIDNLSKQVSELKDRQKNAKRGLKQKEDQFLVISAQLQSYRFKARSGDQLSRYELDGIKQELNKTKRDAGMEAMKCVQLTQKVSSLNSEISRTRNELESIKEHSDKQALIFKQRISVFESSNKQLQRSNDQLNSLIANIKGQQKDSELKIHKFEVDVGKSEEKIEKLLKDIRCLEDKIQQQDNQMKNRSSQIVSLSQVKQALQKKIVDMQQKLSISKNSLNTVTGEKNKNDKIIELLQREISQLKQNAEEYTKMADQKDKQEQQLQTQIKKLKEDYLKLDMKNSSVKKQYDRFKDILLQTLGSNFSQIPLGTDMKASAASLEPLGKRSGTFDSVSMNTQIINKINSQNKDIKATIHKISEHNKVLQKQLQRVSEQNLTNAAKAQLKQASLLKKIEDLEDSKQTLCLAKQQQKIRHQSYIQELEAEIEERQKIIKELDLQMEQLNFTINSIKMDQQANNEHYRIKTNQNKMRISEFEQKIVYLTSSVSEMESTVHNLESKLEECRNELEVVKQENMKKDKQIVHLTEDKRTQLNLIEDAKKTRKELLETISELQLKLSTQIELKQKGKSLLEDEEKKGTELKQFITNLMKQKEIAIKGDLQKSEQIIKLQATLMESNRQSQMKVEQTERLKKVVEDQKETIKRLNNQIKNLELSGSDEKGKVSKINEKVKEKQKQVKQIQDTLDQVRQQLESLQIKSSKTYSQLEMEMEEKLKIKSQQINELSLKLSEMETNFNEVQSKAVTYKAQIVILEQNLFMQKQSGQVNSEQQTKLIQQNQKLQINLKQLQQTVELLNDELKQKEEGMFQLSGKMYELEGMIESKQNDKNERISLLMDDWNSKYDSMIQEYEQRIQLIEKEKNYFKIRLQEKEEEYRKVVAQSRNNQLDEAGVKKSLEEKVRRLEDERLSLISLKNSQIQRLAQQNKSKFDILKLKQADLRRLQHELEVARSTITKIEQTKKETDDKMRQANKAYQSQLEQFKKRENQARSLTEHIERIKWDVEREIKKSLQTFSKKLSSQSKEDGQRWIFTIKGLEEEIVSTVSNRLVLSVS